MQKLEALDLDNPETCPNCGQLMGEESTCQNCGAMLCEDDEFDLLDAEGDID